MLAANRYDSDFGNAEPVRCQMTIRKVEIERLTMISSKPFDAVVAAVEDAIGRPDMREFEKAT
jgi:hypothetical protein